MQKYVLVIVLAALAAAGIGWLASSASRDVAPPIIVMQAPPAPAAAVPATVPATVAEPAPAPAPAVREAVPAQRPVARPAARPVSRAGNRPAPAPPAAEEPEPVAASAPEPVREARAAEPEPEPEPRRAAPVFPTQKLPPPPPPEPRSVTIPAGTLITVRLAQSLSTARNSEGDAFTATLDQPLVVNGLVIAERGSRQMGKIALADAGGRVKGRAALGLELVTLNTADGQSVHLQTETFLHEADSNAGRDAAKAGVMAGIGAAIGAMAGGGRGAAIGAAAGGAAGAGTVMATRGREAQLPAETRISFRLTQPVTLTEKLN